MAYNTTRHTLHTSHTARLTVRARAHTASRAPTITCSSNSVGANGRCVNQSPSQHGCIRRVLRPCDSHQRLAQRRDAPSAKPQECCNLGPDSQSRDPRGRHVSRDRRRWRHTAAGASLAPSRHHNKPPQPMYNTWINWQNVHISFDGRDHEYEYDHHDVLKTLNTIQSLNAQLNHRRPRHHYANNYLGQSQKR